jgi:phosphatidylglycerophosphatase A
MSWRSRIAWTLATWFGCGLVPIAPGTAGTLGAVPLYLAIRGHGPVGVLVVAAAIAAIGVWASNIVVRESGEKDPQRIVVDEVAGVLVALAAAPPTWGRVILGIVLFRIFDVVKPFPARRAERLPAGWGVVVDDLVAGGWTAVVLLATRAAN